MRDTVWITLTLGGEYMHLISNQKMTFMFGAGGIIQFCPTKDAIKKVNGSQTTLITDKGQICHVKESSDEIMTILIKVRQTEGLLGQFTEEQEEESFNQDEALEAKESSQI